ncbi:hypothetical protein [Bradyrhizobium sp.]|uniref:hypothetical protein n=1 Tax=Bradyrhizobium sp. TaxID=376 RepID=UPI004037A160
MLRFRILASVVPLAVTAFLARGELFADTHPCIAVADTSVQLTSLPWQSSLQVSFTTNPAKATVRVQVIDQAEAADFAVIDDATAEGSGCQSSRPPQLVSISKSFSAADPVIYLTKDGPADYRIFVQSKTFSMLDAAALIVGARGGRLHGRSASL